MRALRARAARGNRRELSQRAGISRLDDVDELLVRADLIDTVEHLCPGARLQHRADLTQTVLPDPAIAHVEQDGAIVLNLRALNIAQVQANGPGRGRWRLGGA